MGNWLVYDNGTALHTGLQVVFPGNIITGAVYQDPTIPCVSPPGESGTMCAWIVEYQVNGGGLHSFRTIARGPYTSAQSGVLEIWFLEACAQLPASQPPAPTTTVSFNVTTLSQAGDQAHGQPRSIAVPKNFIKCPGPACNYPRYQPSCGYDFINMGGTSGSTFLFWNTY